MPQTEGASKRDPNYIGDQERAYTMPEFLCKYDGKSRKQIINDLEDKSKTFLHSQPGGFGYRYVVNPHDGRILDMRHMLVVGKQPVIMGNLVEIGQLIFDPSIALSRQDWYSNGVGYQFYRQSSSLQRLIAPTTFTDQLNSFFSNPRVIYNW